MKKIKLLTFYNRQTTENPSWEVYGHYKTGHNDLMDRFKTRSQAIEYCHTFVGIPVMQGVSNSIEISKLLDLFDNQNS